MKQFFSLLAMLTLLTSPALASDTIKIGAFFDLSGRAAFIGTPTKLVAEMVVDKINSEGGINGKLLELEVGDTEANPSKAASLAKRFIYKDQVTAIIGPTMTDTGMNVKKIADKGKTPIFMTVGGDPVIMAGKFGSFEWVFKSPQRSSIAVQRLFSYLKEKGLSRVALLSANDGFGQDGARWMKKLAPEYGIELACSASEGDRMPATKLLVADALPDSDPQKAVIQNFIQLYKEKGYDKQFPINTHSGYAWDAIMIVANAMKKVGTDRAALRQEIENTKGYVGVSGIYNLTAEDHNGLAIDSMVIVEVKNGKFVLAD